MRESMKKHDILEKRVQKLLGDNLDWFFKQFLRDHYERRRQALRENKDNVDLIPAIDYIMKTFIDDSSTYPPDSVSRWHECFTKLRLSKNSLVFQQMLLIYLESDIKNYLAIRERESSIGKSTRSKDKTDLSILDRALKRLEDVPLIHAFPIPVMQLTRGLWALDNDQAGLVVCSLSHPTINLSNYFGSPKDLVRIIIGTLHRFENYRIALYISRVLRYDQAHEQYDQLHVYLLLAAGQIVEALKYERVFADQDNYSEILQNFFELCSRLDVTKSMNRLNLSVEEEEALNHYLVMENSRPVTPASMVASNISYQTKRVTICESSSSKTPIKPTKQSVHSPRNKSVQKLRKMPSFSDSPARNTRLARKKKVEN